MALGSGLQRLAGKVFRIGHMGDINDVMLTGTLTAIEMGMAMSQMPHKPGGTAAAQQYLALGDH